MGRKFFVMKWVDIKRQNQSALARTKNESICLKLLVLKSAWAEIPKFKGI